ncbi:hypothetical protein CFRS1_v015112 [Colletotrichum fructicola]|nr:hypothetical protein CFRS1_v015112 [Colletotrichum fructicola]
MKSFQVHPADPELQKLIRAETPKFEATYSHGLDGCVEVLTEEHRAILDLFHDRMGRRIINLIEGERISSERQFCTQTKSIGPLRAKGRITGKVQQTKMF